MATSKTKKTPEPQESECCTDWKNCATEFVEKAQKMAREEPAKVTGIALGAGLLLTALPVGRVLGGLVRLAFALLRPALLILGAVKLWEEIEKRTDK